MIILGCAVVTFIPRVLPLVVFSRFQMPDWLVKWLSHIPVAVMAALLAQELFIQDGSFAITTNYTKWLAAVAAFGVAILTRSLLGTVITGVLCMMLVRLITGT